MSNPHAAAARARDRHAPPERGAKPAQRQDAPSGHLQGYQDKVLAFASRIRQTTDIAEIIYLLDAALRETSALNSQNELTAARRDIASAEQKIRDLKGELEQARMLLCVDPLTQTLNRRGLEDAYWRESSRADRHRLQLAIVMIDLDDFKRLNDEHGHLAGDAALAHVAAVLRMGLRPNDVLGRYGGEEFLMILPDTVPDAAENVISRLREDLADRPVLHGRSSLQITFSAGVSERQHAESLESAIARADAALYRAKQLGKNRTLLSSLPKTGDSIASR